MRLIDRVRRFRQSREPRPLDEWFRVTFGEEDVRLEVEPPGGEPWTQSFAWLSIDRIVFKAEDLSVSDGIYVFTTERPESYVIPVEANGGAALWNEILRRGLFDAELAIEAASAARGVFTWPPVAD